MPDRASRRFFTSAILRPNGGSAFASVSQKILSATACRYMILWCSLLLQKIECTDQHFMCLGICLIPKFVLQINCLKAWYIHLFQALQINICARWMCGLMGALATMEVLMLKHGRMLPPYIEYEFKRAYNVYRSALNSLADRAIGVEKHDTTFVPSCTFLDI